MEFKNQKKTLLVLDIDETLIFATDKELNRKYSENREKKLACSNGRRMKKVIIKLTLLLISLFLFSCLISPHVDFLLRRSINNQIAFLEGEFQEGLGQQLQNNYPEGELFSNLIFALSIIEYAEFETALNPSSVERAIFASLSEDSQLNYEEALPLKFGAFYNGWINYILKKYIASSLFEASPNQDRIKKIYQDFSQRIVASQKDSIQLLETYSNSIWPADNLVCIASLSDEHSTLKKGWLAKIRQTSKDHLINHYGGDLEEVRGSSQALINYFLVEIDAEYAQESQQAYRKRFEDKFLGISFIKEYESAIHLADIDSGPVILGYGSVATIMHTKLLGKLHLQGSRLTYGFLNLLGLPINLFGKKYYLLGQEPMFDIFMLWNAVGILKNH